jgi:hypothetical protein
VGGSHGARSIRCVQEPAEHVHGRNFDVDAAQALEYIELSERVVASLPQKKPLDD